MGKKAQIRREKELAEKKQRQEIIRKVRYEKQPWLYFWRRLDFWTYVVCLMFLLAYPFYSSWAGLSGQQAVIHTDMGNISVELYPNEAPKNVANFIKLAKEGFYNNLTWHRVVKDFVIQTGDPKGDGTGGPGYTVEDELNSHKFVPGTLGVANSGPNTNGSQFFIITSQDQTSLDGKYTAFGQVTAGMDVVGQIAAVPVDDKDKPTTPVYVKSVDIK